MAGRRLCCLARNAACGRGRKSTDAVAGKRSRRSRPSARSAHPRPCGARTWTDCEETWRRSGHHGKKRPRRRAERPAIAHQRRQRPARTNDRPLPRITARCRRRRRPRRECGSKCMSGDIREPGLTEIASGRRRRSALGIAGRKLRLDSTAGGRTATQAGHHVVSLTRSGTGRCISSISRVSCEARRSSRTAFASAFSARFRSAAFCVASCRS